MLNVTQMAGDVKDSRSHLTSRSVEPSHLQPVLESKPWPHECPQLRVYTTDARTAIPPLAYPRSKDRRNIQRDVSLSMVSNCLTRLARYLKVKTRIAGAQRICVCVLYLDTRARIQQLQYCFHVCTARGSAHSDPRNSINQQRRDPSTSQGGPDLIHR